MLYGVCFEMLKVVCVCSLSGMDSVGREVGIYTAELVMVMMLPLDFHDEGCGVVEKGGGVRMRCWKEEVGMKWQREES